ncbi:hypothetical protein [Paraclostridium sordellii]|uniref:hypothetical protein n=1 Tax=Paraclostridium sordellii TaxID=1505 RepID=UPI0005E18E99|nr:hypothetical protein [Paeniclostridium sordellii]CEP39742.1 Uncharacterised protein [[Clostridium] sordellii] [Paeniclostridium sordellii]
MEILRLKKEIIRENKKKIIGKDVFRDTYKGIDKIELDKSLFTVALAKYEGVKSEEILFTDAIVKIEFEEDKDIIDRIIEINNSKYCFYMATASDLKKSSCIFIKEEYYSFGQWLKEQATGAVEYKLVEKDKVTIMKETAYQGFVFSGSQKTNIIPKVVIIEEPKYLYRGLHTVLEGVETAETIDNIQLVEKEIEMKLTAFDGQGVMSKNLAYRVAKDLNIEHNLSWITFRLYAGIGGKGVATAVDIEKELLRINKEYGETEHLKMIDGELMIRDIWNKYHKVKDVDMILNESQCKLVKHFDGNYLDNVANQVDDIFKCLYVCKYNPKKLSSSNTKLNYQFVQALNLSYDELLELTKDDREHLDASLENIDSLLITCDLADIIDENDIDDKQSKDKFSLMLELVKYDSSLLKDWAVQQEIQKLLKSRINKVAYGKTFLNDASYRLIIQDVQVYMNFIATRNMDTARNESCLQVGEFYSVGRPDKQRTVMGRNPLSSSQELVKFENKKNSYIDSLNYNCASILVMNTFDATASRMSGADFDGDIACSIVDDTIYNAVVELDTPLFFNTFDGVKMDLPYTPENIKRMTKECAGNFIGALALANAGVMNLTNEYPYMLQDGTLLSNSEFYNKVKNEFKLKTSEQVNIKMQELMQAGVVVDTMSTNTVTDAQKKEFIKGRHKELRKMQYLILYAQQVAIDTSKTGIEIPENIKKILKDFSEKPYFFRYARNEKSTTIRNSVIDRYAYGCAKHYYTQSFNLMKDVTFTIEDEVKQSKKNVFLDMFDRASVGANENNVAVIVNELNDIFNSYKAIRQGLRNADKTSIYYKETHDDNNYRTQRRCNELYNQCSPEDLYKAIATVKLRNDYILNFFAPAIVDVVKTNNPKVRTFYKGEHPEKDGAVIIQIGNRTYTRTFEFIDMSKVNASIVNQKLKYIQRELEKNSSALVLRFKADKVDLNDKECTAVRNKDGYSYSLIVDGAVTVDKAYLYNNGVAVTKAEKINLKDIKFKRALKKNDEYVCKSI